MKDEGEPFKVGFQERASEDLTFTPSQLHTPEKQLYPSFAPLAQEIPVHLRPKNWRQWTPALVFTLRPTRRAIRAATP